MLPSRTLLLLVLTIALPHPAAEEVVETFADGAVQRRYEVDDQGRRNGAYEEFSKDGTLIVRARYRQGELHGREQRFDERGKRTVVANWKAGALHGRYESYHPNGKRSVSASYDGGKLSGKYTETSADGERVLTAEYEDDLLDGKLRLEVKGKLVTKQEWAKGELKEIDGLEVFPKPREVLLSELAEILAAPAEGSEASAEGGDPLHHERMAALRRLQAYRHLCGLRWEHLELVPEWNRLCDAASEICRRLGGLSHTPERPPDTEEELYRDGCLGASSSNLSMGGDLAGSVDSYMDDSDASNIDRVGHRRWCLNPAMGRTGFGKAGGFSAMWAMDASGGGGTPKGGVLFPPAGYVPTHLFGGHCAWSVSHLRKSIPKAEEISIRIQPLGEHYLPEGDPLEIDYLNVSTSGFGGSPCLIFRPKGLQVEAERAYRCQVSFDRGKSFELDYVVQFVEYPRPADSRK